jgi:hypothetical protein
LGTRERGATIVEFSIAIVVILLLVAFFVDVAVTYYRYNLLVFGSQRVSRRVAVNVGADTSPAGLQSELQSQLQTYFSKLGAPSGSITVDSANIVLSDCGTPEVRCFLHVQGVTWESFSVMSKLAGGLFNIKTETKVLIEDPCFQCAAIPCP